MLFKGTWKVLSINILFFCLWSQPPSAIRRPEHFIPSSYRQLGIRNLPIPNWLSNLSQSETLNSTTWKKIKWKKAASPLPKAHLATQHPIDPAPSARSRVQYSSILLGSKHTKFEFHFIFEQIWFLPSDFLCLKKIIAFHPLWWSWRQDTWLADRKRRTHPSH